MVFNKQKFLIAIVCTALGWGVGYYMGKTAEPIWWDKFFPTPKDFQGKIFDNGMSVFGGGDSGEFKTREDNEYVYYEYETENLSKDSLNVRVENNMVIIEGNETKEAFGARMNSSFHRAFPVPADVDSDKVQMDYTDKKLIIKFPKVRN
jgi:HSP20 family molecular chaperone IbpA